MECGHSTVSRICISEVTEATTDVHWCAILGGCALTMPSACKLNLGKEITPLRHQPKSILALSARWGATFVIPPSIFPVFRISFRSVWAHHNDFKDITQAMAAVTCFTHLSQLSVFTFPAGTRSPANRFNVYIPSLRTHGITRLSWGASKASNVIRICRRWKMARFERHCTFKHLRCAQSGIHSSGPRERGLIPQNTMTSRSFAGPEVRQSALKLVNDLALVLNLLEYLGALLITKHNSKSTG